MGNQKSPSEAISRWWYGGYCLDWLLCILLIVITNTVMLHQLKFQDRFYHEDDPSLSYPRLDGTVPSWLLYLVVFVGPLLIFSLCQIRNPCFLDLHHACLSVLEAYALACVLKRTLNKVGRHRPYWLTAGDDVDDADRSAYPSGHAAYSFSSMTVLFWYLTGRFRVFSEGTRGQFAKVLIACAPVGVAVYIAASRIVDYKHWASDVNAGSFIGLVSGTVAYFLQYHWVFDAHSGETKSRDAYERADASSEHVAQGSTAAYAPTGPDKKAEQ